MPIAANANNVSFSLINTELGRTSTTQLAIGTRFPRIYANSSSLSAQVSVANFRNRSFVRSWGLTRSFYFRGSLSNQLPTNPLTYFPLLTTGDVFSVVQAGGIDGWSDANTRVYEYFLSYGTSWNSPGYRNKDFRKSTWQAINFNGTNLITFDGYYSGDKTDFPQGTNYVLALRYYGPGPISGITTSTAQRLGISETQYLLQYPRNEF